MNLTELKILDWIQDTFGCGPMDKLMPVVSFLGNVGIFWIVIAVAMMISKKYRKYGFRMAAALIICVLVGNLIIKNIVMRSRPCWINESFALLIKNPPDYSFPSGHTTSSFAAAFAAAKADKKIGVVSYIVAVMIAFSRMYLYVHFPTDILGGVVLGTLIAFLVCRAAADENFMKKIKKPFVKAEK